MQKSHIIVLLTSLLLVGIFLPLSLANFTGNSIVKTTTTYLNDDTTILNNGTSGLFNGTNLIVGNNYEINITIDLSSDLSVNFTAYFKISVSNLTAIVPIVIDVYANGARSDFNSTFGANFTFNTLYAFDFESSITELKIRLLTENSANATLTTNAWMKEYETDSNTDLMNDLFVVIAIFACLALMFVFVKSKDE
jgi:hypothetical protein